MPINVQSLCGQNWMRQSPELMLAAILPERGPARHEFSTRVASLDQPVLLRGSRTRLFWFYRHVRFDYNVYTYYSAVLRTRLIFFSVRPSSVYARLITFATGYPISVILAARAIVIPSTWMRLMSCLRLWLGTGMYILVIEMNVESRFSNLCIY